MPFHHIYDVPFHHIPVTAGAKPEAEAQLTSLIAEQRVDLVILARYRQVLFPELRTMLEGRVVFR